MALVDAKVIWRANNFGLLQIRGFGCVLGSRRALHRDSGVNRVSTGTIVLSARLSCAVIRTCGAHTSLSIGLCSSSVRIDTSVRSAVTRSFGDRCPLRIIRSCTCPLGAVFSSGDALAFNA